MKNEAEKIDKPQGNGVLPYVSGSYSAPFCKACLYWTVIDILGGEYCRKLERL